MLRIFATILLAVVIMAPAFSQSSLNIFAGYGKSAFDLEDGEEQSGYIPVGAQLLFGDRLQFGGEISYAIVPFKFEYSEADIYSSEITLNQMYFGGLVRFNLGEGNTKPYLRGGIGLYSGDLKIEEKELWWGETYEESYEIEMESAIGFNVGAGISTSGNTSFFIEAVYHIVERGPKDYDDKTKMNHYGIQAGIQFSL